MAEKKLSYKEVPKALWYVIVVLWRVSPSYVLIELFASLKDRLIPFATLFITAAITSALPDLVGGKEPLSSVMGLVVLGVVLQLASRLIDLLIQKRRTEAEAYVTINMREHFYHSYSKLPYHLYEDKEVIDAFEYADQFMYRFSNWGLRSLVSVVGSIIELAIAMVSLVTVAWFMPLLLLVYMPFLLRSLFKLNRLQARLSKQNRAKQRRIWIIEYLFMPRQIKETRLYGIVDHLLGERRVISQKIKVKELDLNYKRAKMTFTQDTLNEGAGFVASAIALWRIAYRGAPLGTLVLAQQLTSRASGAISRIFDSVSTFDEDLYGFAEYQYITETLQPKPRDDLVQELHTPTVSIKNVSFKYPKSEHHALRKVNLEIPYGSSLAVVGENGAGKTTLTRLILGLYRPSEGEIFANGVSVSDYDEAIWLRQLGVLLQDFGINQDITFREAVWLGDVTKPKDDKAIMAAIEAAELDDMVKELPNGLDTFIGKWVDEDNGTDISGGQLQRLAIARVLFRDPPILVLDEPTSAIDAIAEERIFTRLMESRQGKTTVFISHRFSTVRRAKHIVYMEHGRIAETGTHDELMALDGKYAEMFMTQAKGYA